MRLVSAVVWDRMFMRFGAGSADADGNWEES